MRVHYALSLCTNIMLIHYELTLFINVLTRSSDKKVSSKSTEGEELSTSQEERKLENDEVVSAGTNEMSPDDDDKLKSGE